jgi:hypothetical protein
MPIFVRTRNGAKSYALRVRHARLAEPAYLTFDREAEVRRTGELAEAALNRGEMPPGGLAVRSAPEASVDRSFGS